MVEAKVKQLVSRIGLLILFLGIVGSAQPAQAAWPFDLFPAKKSSVTNPATRIQPAANPKPAIFSFFLPQINNRVIEEAKAMETGKVVAGWLTPWGDDSFQSFKNNLDVLTEVHPFVYTIDSDGVGLVEEGSDWHKEEILRLAREHNIKVIPTIAGDVDHSDLMLNDPAKRTAHIDQIMAAIEKNGYDGFDIDYEGFLNGYNRDVYASFMKELSGRMKKEGKILAIAIEAFNRQQNWEALGEAVDRFMIMGYDYHAAKTIEPGPIGPASWLAEVVDYAATRVPKEKIVLGLGTYGYSWIADGSGQYISEAVGHRDALDIAKSTDSTIKRSQDETAYFIYDRGFGERHLYFEDKMSTQPKLTMAHDKEIGGIALWRLGTEDKGIWQDIADYRSR